MTNVGATFVTIIASIVGLAIVAVLVSQKAQTAGVIQAGGTALSSIIGAAVGPVTGQSSSTFGSSASNTGGSAQ